MSHAELPQEPVATPETEHPVQPPARSGSGLAVLALLVALGAVAVSGWNAWQWQQEQQALAALSAKPAEPLATQAQLQQVLARTDEQQASWRTLEQNWQAREAEFAELKAAQQQSQALLANVQLNARQDLRLAEAEHLLRLASLRLSALEDVASAVALVRGADEVLREQDDPRAYAVRKVLAQNAEALAALPLPDRTGLFLRLGALRDQIGQLQDLAPTFAAQPTTTTAPGWEQWLSKLSEYVRIDFRAEQDIQPLLSGQHLAQARLALNLAIQQAQWAVLQGDEAIYRDALNQAQTIYTSQFSRSAQRNQSLAERIKALADEPVSVAAPDLRPALDALQAYMKARREAALPPPSSEANDEGVQP